MELFRGRDERGSLEGQNGQWHIHDYACAQTHGTAHSKDHYTCIVSCPAQIPPAAVIRNRSSMRQRLPLGRKSSSSESLQKPVGLAVRSRILTEHVGHTVRGRAPHLRAPPLFPTGYLRRRHWQRGSPRCQLASRFVVGDDAIDSADLTHVIHISI